MTTPTQPIVLFDMDGTLLDLAFDDFIWNHQVPTAYAQLHQCSISQSKEKLNHFYEQNRHSLDWYSSKFWQTLTHVDILALHHQHAHLVKKRPHCDELLTQLRKMGIECWLVTNADLANLTFKLNTLPDFSHYFTHIISSEQIGYAKEDVRFWQTLHQRYPFNPQHAVLLDDTLPVLTSATTFGIAHPFTILQPSSTQPPRNVHQLTFPHLQDLLELIPFLQQQFSEL